LEGKLRIGLAEQTIITALAHAAVLSDSRKLRINDLSEARVIKAPTVFSFFMFFSFFFFFSFSFF